MLVLPYRLPAVSPLLLVPQNDPSPQTTPSKRPPTQAIESHLRQQPHLLPEILKTLFEIILFEECSNQWSLSRPMLSLILINEAVYPDLQRQVRGRRGVDWLQTAVGGCVLGLRSVPNQMKQHAHSA